MAQNILVLVVDDEHYIRTILSRIVKRDGFSVLEASNGVEALRTLNAYFVDIIISDISMPEMDGLELLVHVKTDFPSIKVLLVTGQAGRYSPEEIIAAGADYFIAKPFRAHDISATLRRLAS